MYPTYSDIRDKLGTPTFHDSNGVPRYEDFHPDMLGIYDHWAVLYHIQCQSCEQNFPCAVGMYWGDVYCKSKPEVRQAMLTMDRSDPMQALKLMPRWGDAPWHELDDGLMCSGVTMCTSVHEVLEVWHRADGDWQRIEISDEIRQLFEK